MQIFENHQQRLTCREPLNDRLQCIEQQAPLEPTRPFGRRQQVGQPLAQPWRELRRLSGIAAQHVGERSRIERMGGTFEDLDERVVRRRSLHLITVTGQHEKPAPRGFERRLLCEPRFADAGLAAEDA
jgi:hypothetical protein